MKILRNSEIKNAIILLLAISIVFCILSYSFDIAYGLLTTLFCLVFLITFICLENKRYQNIIDLSTQIDALLHQDLKINFTDYSEGELSILKNELQKMTLRLREQQETLQKDKIYLTDSIADISHQIRTPLTSINLITSLLSDPSLTNQRKQELLHDLYRLLSQIDWLINSLLKISKLDAGTIQFYPTKISLEQFLKYATESLLIPIELRQQNLIIHSEGMIETDITWSKEAVSNIIKNCMEHTPSGGTITVTASDNPLYTSIEITDTGSGISKKDLPHIFERFYHGDHQSKESYGIGLALARTIIVSQNGTIKAENNQTVGAKFTIHFYKETI